MTLCHDYLSGLQGCACTRQFLCAHDNLGVFGGADVCNVKQHNWYFGHGGESPVTLILQKLTCCVHFFTYQSKFHTVMQC